MKYIIEIENEPFGRNDDPFFPHGMDELYRAKGFKSLVFDQNGLNKLTPYTEPDQKAIDLQHAHDIENVARMNYSKGAEDAWEFAKKVRLEVFTDEEGRLRGYISGFDSYSEAKATYEAWKKQKDEIRVGDEVKTGDSTGIVYMVTDEKIYGVCNNTPYFIPFEWYISLSHKTGRHFDEVEALLKKMGDEK